VRISFTIPFVLIEKFSGFTQSLQVNTGIVHQFGHGGFLPVHHPSTIEPFSHYISATDRVAKQLIKMALTLFGVDEMF
jgi:hypothetical protein